MNRVFSMLFALTAVVAFVAAGFETNPLACIVLFAGCVKWAFFVALFNAPSAEAT